MRQTLRASLIGGLGLLLALPAAAQTMQGQTMPGAAKPAATSTDAPRSGAPSEILRHSREQAAPTSQRSLGSTAEMGLAARRADSEAGARQPARLLDEAQRAFDRGNWSLATELTERAQTSLLNEHVQSGAGTDTLRAVGEAGAALNARDRSRARDALRNARSVAAQEAARPSAATGSMGGAAMPGQGGGAAMGNPVMGSPSNSGPTAGAPLGGSPLLGAPGTTQPGGTAGMPGSGVVPMR
jgi:hypothetical protein